MSTITQLLCFYISKDSNDVLINFIDKEGKHEYINYILKFIHFIIIQCDKVNNDYYEYTYIFYICNNLFDRYKNKVDIILQDILELIIAKYKNNKNQKMLDYLCLLLSISFIYFPEQCLIYFQKKCCIKDIFMFWFFQIDKIISYKHLKFNLFAICSLITLDQKQQDKLILENIKLFVDKILLLIERINKKIEKEEKKENKEKKNEEGEESDDDIDGDELFKKFIVEGNDINDDEDDDDNWEENEDDENFPETEADKQDPILFVKNTFELINKKFPELFSNIVKLLGDNANKLSEIFSKREEKIKNDIKK